MKTLQGHLLIAPPHERDLDFIRTVILLIQHSEEQAFGVVLNRPTATTLRQQPARWRRCDDDECVYSGGPVSGPLLALHTDPFLGEIEVLPGVFCSVRKKTAERTVRTPRHPVKVFQSSWLGTWSTRTIPGGGPWRILPATAEHVFSVGRICGKRSQRLPAMSP